MNDKYLDDFFNYLKNQKRYSIHTINSYKNDLKFFFEYIKKENINKIDNLTIQSYLSHLYLTNISTSSVSRKLSSIKSYSTYLSKYKNMDCSFVKATISPKKTKHLPEFIHESELKILLNLPTNTFLELRDSLIIHLLYSTGLRLNELTSLKVSDYDPNNPILKINGKGNKERIVLFSSSTKKLIDKYLEIRHDVEEKSLLLNKNMKKLSNRGVELILTNISKKYLGHAKLHPHMLRHTFATKLLNKGMDIRSLQELLGHNSLNATQIYTHIAKNELLEIYSTYHPLGDNSPINLD